jgi:hypothetical protein
MNTHVALSSAGKPFIPHTAMIPFPITENADSTDNCIMQMRWKGRAHEQQVPFGAHGNATTTPHESSDSNAGTSATHSRCLTNDEATVRGSCCRELDSGEWRQQTWNNGIIMALRIRLCTRVVGIVDQAVECRTNGRILRWLWNALSHEGSRGLRGLGTRWPNTGYRLRC